MDWIERIRRVALLGSTDGSTDSETDDPPVVDDLDGGGEFPGRTSGDGGQAVSPGGTATDRHPTDGAANRTQRIEIADQPVSVQLPADVDVDPEKIEARLSDTAAEHVSIEGQTNEGDSATVTPIAKSRSAELSGRFQDLVNEYDRIRDDKIQKLRENRVDYNDLIGRWLLENDDRIPAILNHQIGLVLGQTGLGVEPEDPNNDADRRLADHMESIYSGDADMEAHVTPGGVVRAAFEQNYLAATSVLRSLDLAELPLDTISYFRDPETGDEFYIQEAISYQTAEVDLEDNSFETRQDHQSEQVLEIGTHVFDVELFGDEPLRGIADVAVNKMVLQRLKARKAEIASVGGLYIKVEPPEWLPENEWSTEIPDPDTDGETVTKLELQLREDISNAFDRLQEYQSGFIMSIPAHWTVEQIEVPEVGEPMDEQIRGYNQAIAARLLFPLDLMELREGAELSRDTLFRTLLNTIAGWRREFLDMFDAFAEVQKEIHGLAGNVTHSFPQLEAGDEELVVNALQFAGLAGMTTNEVRKMLNQIEGIDLDISDDIQGPPADDEADTSGGPENPSDREQSMKDFMDTNVTDSDSPSEQGTSSGVEAVGGDSGDD